MRGVDYSKAVIIPDYTYIDNVNKPYIRKDEHSIIKRKKHKIKKEFLQYISKYQLALKNLHIERNQIMCRYSTLQGY